MAFKSSTQPSSLKTTSNTLDPYLQTSPMPSSGATCSQNTANLSCASVQPVLPKKSPSNPSVQKHSYIESLNNDLKDLIKRKLMYQVLMGQPSDTLDFHRHKLIEELIEWIQPSQNVVNTYDSTYRDELMTLLSSASKHHVKDVPLDESEWLKLMNQWIRNTSNEEIIVNREVYKILAVDGFHGFRPKDLKHYLTCILLPLRSEFKMHAKGVRAMYEYFDQNLSIESLTGTDSACTILLALLKLYAKLLKERLTDDLVRYQLQQVQSWAEGLLHKHSEYYRDVKHVDEMLLRTLGNIYSEQFTDLKKLKYVGSELLKNLSVLCDDKLKR